MANFKFVFDLELDDGTKIEPVYKDFEASSEAVARELAIEYSVRLAETQGASVTLRLIQ